MAAKKTLLFFLILSIILFGCSTEKGEFDSLVLEDIDRLIINNQIIKVKKDIAEYIKRAKTSTQFKSLLKRALRISLNEEDFSFYTGIAEQAVQRLPGNDEFWYCLTYGKMRMGLYDEAYEIAEERLKDNKYNYIKGEINLKKELLILKENNSTMNLDLNPKIYERLGNAAEDQRFFLNAGLLWLIRGDFEQAVKVLLNGRNNYYFFDILARIHYLQGNYQDAVEYLDKLAILEPGRMDIVHILGDISMYLRNFEEAEDYYFSIINTRPELFWKPYFNILYLQDVSNRDDFEKQFFPFLIREFADVPNVMEKYIAYLLKNKDMGALKNILEKQTEPLDPHWEYLRITYLSTEGKAKKISALWDIFNKFPDSKDIAEELVLYSFKIKDLEGALGIINNYYNATGDESWYYLYTSVVQALKGEYTSALNTLKQEDPDNWIRYYNISALHYASGDYPGAREMLLIAEDILAEEKDSGSLGEYKSRVFTRLGEIEVKLHNYAVAYRNLQEALKYNEYNEKAIFLLKSIEKR